MRIAVIGASGFVGRALSTALTAAAHDVIAIARSPTDIPGTRSVTVDVADEDGLRDALSGCEVVYYLVHSLGIGDFRDRDRRLAAAEGPLEQLVAVSHPIVRAHPFTAEPALYFDLDRATHIDGLPEADGRALLQRLQDHAETAAPRYAHHWQPYDVLIWDNAAVQHKASGDFPVGEPRNFWRYMIEGPEPAAFRLPNQLRPPAPGRGTAGDHVRS